MDFKNNKNILEILKIDGISILEKLIEIDKREGKIKLNCEKLHREYFDNIKSYKIRRIVRKLRELRILYTHEERFGCLYETYFKVNLNRLKELEVNNE